MEQPKKAAAKPKPQGYGGLRLEDDGGVVQAKFLQCVPKLRVVVSLHGIETAEHDALDLTVPGKRLRSGVPRIGNRVPNVRLGQGFDAGGHVTDLSRPQPLDGREGGTEHPYLVHGIGHVGRHEQDILSRGQGSVHDPHVADDASIVVVHGIEDQSLKGGVRVPPRGRNRPDDALQNLVDPPPVLRAGQDGVVGIQPHHVSDLLFGALGVGRGEVDFIDHRQNFESLLDRLIGVGNRLRLDPLRRVHDQERPFAGCQGARYLVAEVHVARRVDEVQNPFFTVRGRVVHTHRHQLDRDAPLPLQREGVQQLISHIS